ncbi:DUF3019 domain-containing protein [Thalassotalea sp. HSM 43]|uniref:DUF3019 domain-containing protein n=1 Tax=Thalassotalea sp. HSM 43 TaxID=2552945 RepID=UPI0010800878|nr:DUF3019 domain-containing protein [Thalassotalea sp. HSM 43]QBY03403.1 DUF3019 domain-containing protein [Thalassotalea sp. HSM 43]
MKYSVKVLALLALLMSMPSLAQADETVFSVMPNKCIVKNKGESCNTELTLQWQLPDAQNICILKNNNIVHCQQNSKQGSFVYPVETAETLNFKLVEMTTLTELSTFKFSLLYLGKTSAKRRKLPWRLL